VYELSPPAQKGGTWTEQVLYSFPTPKEGYAPVGDLVFDSSGDLYGATAFGGGYGTTCDEFYQYCGAIFELSPPQQKGGSWTEQTLYGFTGTARGVLTGDGGSPNGGLIIDTAGNIYGTTMDGGFTAGACRVVGQGGPGCGTAFRLSPPSNKGGTWTEVILHRFNYSDGSNPLAGFVMDSMGNLYTTTLGGGTGGMVVRFTRPNKPSNQWSESILHGFSFNGGYDPEGPLTFDANGNLCGTTYTGNGDTLGGTVFRMNAPQAKSDGWTWQLLYAFGSGKAPEAYGPNAPVVLDNAGNLYSTTQYGGTGTGCTFTGCGTVFELEP
jgi:hypothetical protein